MQQQPLSFDCTEDELIHEACQVLERRLRYRMDRHECLTQPKDAMNLARLRLAELPYEVFAVFFLDNRHRLIAFEELFQGTIDGASVHPREVVRRTIAHNAAALVLAHNHPSGVAEPSAADLKITRQLTEALKLLDVRVIDHIVVGDEVLSLAESGLI